VERAFQAAAEAGLDLQKARADMKSPAIEALLAQDVQDLTALEVTKTPTFFVNGRGLPSFGPQQLEALVAEELAKPAPQTR
jgi:predicted DsbA family dithiol-disulfide isomerase